MDLDIAKKNGDKAGEGEAYGKLGNSYQSMGQYDKAFEYHNKHLDITKEIGDKSGEGQAYGNLGVCFHSSGQYDKAFEHHRKHLDITKETGDKAGEGQAYGNLGVCYLSLGEHDKALEHHNMHLEIARQIGDKAGEGKACGNLGECYHSLGQYDKAIEHHNMYLDIARQIGDKAGEGKAHGNLGDCYRSLENYGKALEQYKMHLNIAKEIGDKAGEGKAYGNLGAFYISLDRYDKASEYQAMQLDIARKTGDKPSQGKAYENLGDCYESMRQYEKAVEHHTMHLGITKESGDKDGERQAYHRLGRSYIQLESYDEAEHNCRKSLQCFDELYEAVPDKFKKSMRDTYIETNQLLNVSLLLQDKTDEALVIAEKGLSIALDHRMLTIHPIQGAQDTMAPLSDLPEIREVVETLDSTVLFFALTGSVINIWVLQTNGDVTFKKTTAKVRPSTKPKVYSSPFGNIGALITSARDLLRAGPHGHIEDRSLSFLYPEEEERPRRRPGLMFPYTLMPPVRPAMMADVSRDVPADDGKHIDEWELTDLQELYKIVLEPVRQSLRGSQVVVVPDASLPLIPFAALVDEDGRFTAESLQVRLLPSLATAKMIIENTPEPEDPAASPLIVGYPDVPKFQGDDGIPVAKRLRSVKAQVDKIGQLLNVQPLKAKKATKETVLQRLDSANLIHIATHGDMGKGEIFLAPSLGIPKERVRKEDVVLTISDIERKRLRAKLVVLCCRHSGQGEIKAAGVIGIAHAFLRAGARAVVVNIWELKNDATLYFMDKFYKNLVAGDRANEALDKTMKAMRETEEFWHPYLWAPFVLIGEDVAPFTMQ